MEKGKNSQLPSGLPFIAFFLVTALLLISCGGGDGSSSTATRASLAVWEPPPAVTIYFAGTGLTGSRWQTNSSSWDRELVASLHKWQLTSDIHKKKFIDGIGTGCTSWDWLNIIDLINQGIPGWELCRGWETNIGDAKDFLLDEALPELDGNIILNLVGFSRGGIAAMRVANRVSTIDTISSRIEKINILAFDPVAGDTSLSPDEFVLTEKVKQYIGIYATDERTFMFSPTLPDFESADTEVWMFRVPGAHETMVGNPETDGHEPNINLGCGFLWLEECTDPEILNVSWATTFISERLLGSSQWGALEFDMDQLANWHPGLNDADVDDQFVDRVETLWDYNYFSMRKFGAPLIGFESCQWSDESNTLTYSYYSFLDWPVFSGWPVYGGWNHERCTDWVHKDYFTSPPEAALQRQLLETGPFMWVDPLDDGEWALAMLSQLGKSPPIADAGGPYDGVEGTSIVFTAGGSTDPDGDPVTFRWDFENDGIWDTGWSDDPVAEHTYGDDYTGVARVEASDGTGTDIASAVVTVLNAAPTAGIDTIQGPNPHFILPEIHPVSFMGNYSDPGWLDSHTSTWDVGDGWILPGTITGEHLEPFASGTAATEHTYADSGTYTVVLEVMDDDGGAVTTTATVTVATAGEAAEIINDYLQGLPNNCFKNNSDSSKIAFANKMDVVCKMIAADKIDQSLSKLLHDLRSKVSGNSDGKPQNDWVTDPGAQEDLCMMIDDLMAFLE